MQVFRIGQMRYSQDLSGKGAELYGGRWNERGLPCIYTSSSRALCVLEYAANVPIGRMPAGLAITTYEVPSALVMELPLRELPATWRERPFPSESAAFGSRLLKEGKYAVIGFPSVIIPQEYNYILNPRHADFGEITIREVSAFDFDERIKR